MVCIRCLHDKPDRADKASAGAVKPRKYRQPSHGAPVGAKQMQSPVVCRPYQGFPIRWVKAPGLHSPGRRCTDPPGRGHRHCGSMIVETAIGIALVVIVMVAVAQLVAVVAKQRSEVAQTRLATQELANAMERVIVLPWSELNTAAIAASGVPNLSAAALDDPQWSITVADLDAAFPTKQIEIGLSWRNQANRRVEPVRLVAWKHQAKAAD